MPLPTPFATQSAAGLDATAWWLGDGPRLPGALPAQAATGEGCCVVRVHHAEFRSWRPPVVWLTSTPRPGGDPALLPTDGRATLLSSLASEGHGVWLVGPSHPAGSAAVARFLEHDLPLEQRLIWGHEARAAFWLGDGLAGRWLARVAQGLDVRRTAGLVMLGDPIRPTPWRRASELCRRLTRHVGRAERFSRGAEGEVAGRLTTPASPFPVLELAARPLAGTNWTALLDWLDDHQGHSPERTVRLASPPPWLAAA